MTFCYFVFLFETGVLIEWSWHQAPPASALRCGNHRHVLPCLARTTALCVCLHACAPVWVHSSTFVGMSHLLQLLQLGLGLPETGRLAFDPSVCLPVPRL